MQVNETILDLIPYMQSSHSIRRCVKFLLAKMWKLVLDAAPFSFLDLQLITLSTNWIPINANN